jgi:hypothetical protein
MYTSVMWIINEKISVIMITVEQEKGVGLIALLESVLTQSSHLGHTDMNIQQTPQARCDKTCPKKPDPP